MGIDTRIVRPSDTKDGMYVAQPEDKFVQLIAENGAFAYKNTPFYEAVVKIEQPAELAKLSQACRLRVPKVPWELFKKIENFFEKVYEKHRSEAVVLLYVSPDKRAWRAMVPEQEVSASSVDYDLKKMPQFYEEGGENGKESAKFFLFGSIHSHGTMDAFHSNTDDSDEMHFDGLHITIGSITSDTKSYATRFMIHGSAFPKLKLADAVAVPADPKFECEDGWMESVSEKTFAHVHTGYPGYPGSHSHMSNTPVRNTAIIPGGHAGKVEGVPSPVRGIVRVVRNDKPTTKPTGATGTCKSPAAHSGERHTWKRHAQYEHCFACERYLGHGRCTLRDQTYPFSSCSHFSKSAEVSEAFLRESHEYMNKGGGNGG